MCMCVTQKSRKLYAKWPQKTNWLLEMQDHGKLSKEGNRIEWLDSEQELLIINQFVAASAY